MEQPPKTVINSTLMLWCGVVIAELFVIARLMNSSLVLLLALVMFFPLRAAWNWPAPAGPSADVAPAAK